MKKNNMIFLALLLMAVVQMINNIPVMAAIYNQEGKVHIRRSDVRNATFSIDGMEVKLKNGQVRKGTDSKFPEREIYIARKEIKGDINNDGISDAVVILAVNGGGSGTFLYAAAVISAGTRLVGTNAILLGDRIKITGIEIAGGVIVINYLSHPEGSPLGSEPTEKRSKSLSFSSGKLAESGGIERITGTNWQWEKTVMTDGVVITPRNPGDFTIWFGKDDSFSGKTDCNRYFGQYKYHEDTLSFSKIGATRMFCENSQEDIFMKALQKVIAYEIKDDNQLILLMSSGEGSMIFNKSPLPE